MSHQLSHKEHQISSHNHNITVICDHLQSPANQGALFRICEAFGVKKIIFFGNTIDLTSSRLKRTARNTEKTVPHSCFIDEDQKITEILGFKKNTDTAVIGLEITASSKPISTFKISEEKEIILVIGNEKNGISKTLLSQLDTICHIPMYGANSSMNVIQATGIALYSLIKKH